MVAVVVVAVAAVVVVVAAVVVIAVVVVVVVIVVKSNPVRVLSVLHTFFGRRRWLHKGEVIFLFLFFFLFFFFFFFSFFAKLKNWKEFYVCNFFF